MVFLWLYTFVKSRLRCDTIFSWLLCKCAWAIPQSSYPHFWELLNTHQIGHVSRFLPRRVDCFDKRFNNSGQTKPRISLNRYNTHLKTSLESIKTFNPESKHAFLFENKFIMPFEVNLWLGAHKSVSFLPFWCMFVFKSLLRARGG